MSKASAIAPAVQVDDETVAVVPTPTRPFCCAEDEEATAVVVEVVEVFGVVVVVEVVVEVVVVVEFVVEVVGMVVVVVVVDIEVATEVAISSDISYASQTTTF